MRPLIRCVRVGLLVVGIALLWSSARLFAQGPPSCPLVGGVPTCIVSTEAELLDALTPGGAVYIAPGDTILFANNITLTSDLTAVQQSITINGNGFTLSGNNTYRGIVVGSAFATGGPIITLDLQNITIQNTVAQGGAGGSGGAAGGGGAGMGGALFIGADAAVTVSNVFLVSNSAIGGAGGVSTGLAGDAGGGGGGLGGAGGGGDNAIAGGGGGVGIGAVGGNSFFPAAFAGGAGILPLSGSGGDTGGGAGGPAAGGGGAVGGTGLTAGGGGIAGIGSSDGGFGGGGGGIWTGGVAGLGGFGGGGGGGTASAPGGAGGFGGGGGGSTSGTGGAGGTLAGAGSGSTGGGGGGAGLGGAIFVQNGGTLTVVGTFTVTGASATGGAGAGGAGNGSSFGSGIYLGGANGTLTFSPLAGQTVSIANNIIDNFSAGGGAGAGYDIVVSGGAGSRTILGGTNAYRGNTIIAGGTLSIATNANISGGDVTIGSGTTLELTGSSSYANDVNIGGTSTIAVAPGQTNTWSGQVRQSLPGGLVVTGGGTLVLANVANQQSFGTGVGGGSEVVVSSNGSLGAAGAPVFLGDLTTTGTLGLSGSGLTINRPISLGPGGGGIDVIGSSSATVSGTVSGGGIFTKSGTGTLVLSGTNSYTGTTVVNSGSLFAGSATAFGSSSSLVVNSGALVGLGGFSNSFDTLGGTGAISFSTGETLTVGAGNGSSVFGGAITGAGNLTKAGTGSLTLSGNNTYSGLTSVTGGTLIAGSTTAFGSSSLSVSSGATVDLNGFSQSFLNLSGAGTIALTGGAILTVGSGGANGTFGGTLNGSGGITKAGAGNFTLSGNNSYVGATSVLGGTLTAGSLNAFGASTALSVASGATVDFNGFGHSFFTVSGNGTLALNGGAVLTIGADNSTTAIDATIVGSGGVTKSGSGALTLTGANSFSGGVNVASGTLVVSADTNLGASNGLLTLGSAQSTATLSIGGGGTFLSSRPIVIGGLGAIIDTVTNAQLGGSISGTGGITKTGAGTLTLAASNTFSGAFTVSGGTIRAGATNAFTPGSLSLGAGTTADLNGFNQTINTLSGSGSVLLGGGAFLAIGGDGSSSSFGGAISGTGGLVKNGGGVLSLSGINSYTGGVRVNGGTLLGNTNSILGNIVNNASVVFDQSADGTYAGSMSGSGSLTKIGAGVLTLGGTNSYTGGTLIGAGGLVGTTSSLQGLIVDNGALTFNQATDGVFNGLISGSGTVTKLGLGNVVFGGANSYTGLTTVGQGTLSLTGSLAGSVSVGTQATFSGAGTVGGNLSVGGRLFVPSPSATAFASSLPAGFVGVNRANVSALQPFATLSAPSLIVLGDLITSPGSTLDFNVSSTGAAPILVNGRANIVGSHFTVTIDDPSPARAATYTAIKALNGVTLSGTDAVSPSTSILPILTAGQSAALLTILNLNVPIAGVATSINGVAAGRAIDTVKRCAPGDLCTVVKEVLALADAALEPALRSLAGEIHASSLRILVNDSRTVTDIVRTELSDAEHEAEDTNRSGWSARRPWLQFAGEHTSFKTDIFSGGTSNVGITGGGVDFKPSGSFLTGFGGTFSLGDLSLSDISGKSTLKAPRAFGYTGYHVGQFHFHFGSSVSKNNNSTTRDVSIHAKVPDENGNLVPLSNGVDRSADADQDGYTQDAWGEGQHTKKWESSGWLLDSKLGVRATRYVRRAFNESGAGAISLDGVEDVLKSREAHVDVNLLKRTGAYRPRVVLNYLRELGDEATNANVNFQERPDSQFQVSGIPIPRDMFHGVFGLTVRMLSGLEYTFEYETTQASNESHNAVHFRMRFK